MVRTATSCPCRRRSRRRAGRWSIDPAIRAEIEAAGQDRPSSARSPAEHRALQRRVRVSPTDHLVSEAIYLWDLDGNELVEYGAGLRSVTLGHCHPVVDDAVREAMHTVDEVRSKGPAA